MKHLIVTTLALILGIFAGFGISYTVRQPETAPEIRQNEKPDTATGPGETIVVFAPGGLFNAGEKEYLTKNVTQPMVLYHQLTNSPLVSLMVEKSAANAREVRIFGIQQNGAYSGLIHPINQAWVPDCFNQTCSNIPEKFRTLYPALYQEAARRAR